MGAIVGLRPGVPAEQWMIPAHLAASGAQAVEPGVTGGKAAQSVDDDAYLNSGLSTFRQRCQNFVADAPLQEFVELQVDGILRPADSFHVSGKKLDSVFEPGDVGMPPGAVGDQAEELDELLGVQRSIVLVGHGVGHRRAKVVY